MEKEPESMATVQMKQDYAASEVYSTASEAPPAYKLRQANSVKIAKIIAVTVILSSFILGSFILASTYLQAKSSCDQMQVLDAVLDKELMLEAMQQELPKPEALLQGRELSANENLQSLDKDSTKKEKKDNINKIDSSESNDSSDSDSSYDSDESTDMNNNNNNNRIHIKLPLDLDLSDLAHSVLQNNQKSRMNCVVERRHSEELVDAPAKTMRLPFGVNFETDPKKQKVTGERIAIFCETGNEPRNEDTEPIRQMLIPIPPVRSFGPITHLPQQMPQRPAFPPPPPPPHMMHISTMQQQQQQQQHLPPTPAQMMQAPHPDAANLIRPLFPTQQHLPQQQPQQQSHEQPIPEVRIHLQRIQIPNILRQILPLQLANQREQATPEVQVREVPLDVALQKAGITIDELKDIQNIAARKFADEISQLVGGVDNDSEENEGSSEDNSYQPQQLNDHQQPINPAVQKSEEQMPPQILQMGRSQFARSLNNPIDLPVNMMQQQQEQPSDDTQESMRPHFVQPRSIRPEHHE
uniref:Putative ccr4-not complex subunit 3 n=1 Tax=Corethrella appendiculata TaxID=1370023 RepID=U5EPJ7_9DIPT